MSDKTERQATRRVTIKENIISLLVTKVGLSQDKAEQVFDTIMTYIKANPHQLAAYLSNVGTGCAAGKSGSFFN